MENEEDRNKDPEAKQKFPRATLANQKSKEHSRHSSQEEGQNNRFLRTPINAISRAQMPTTKPSHIGYKPSCNNPAHKPGEDKYHMSIKQNEPKLPEIDYEQLAKYLVPLLNQNKAQNQTVSTFSYTDTNIYWSKSKNLHLLTIFLRLCHFY